MQKTLSVINLSAISKNIKFLRRRAGSAKFYAVVKADAYGHGAERVSLHIQPQVDGFCVALTEEGAALRIAGVTKPVLVLTPLTSADDALAAAFYNLSVTVNGSASARLCAGLSCHIKVNTGMNRYGVYSHLYCPAEAREREAQLALFEEAERLVKAAYPRAVCHISASGGTLLGGKFIKEAVRCGISMYGYAPQGFSREGLSPALKVYARRIQKTDVCGRGAGYMVATKNYASFSAYRLGYADGFARPVPLGEGNLCMDAFVSEEDGEFIEVLSDADEYAARCGTISYEVLCSVTRRSERVYIS